MTVDRHFMFLSPARGRGEERGKVDVRSPLSHPLPLAGERRTTG
jgi:hypothetical protein